MNPIYDCPLSVKAADMAALIQNYERPALLISDDKTIIALNTALKGTGLGVGSSATGIFTREELYIFDALKTGELVNIQLGCDTTLYAEIAKFYEYCFVTFSLRPLPVINEEEKKTAETNKVSEAEIEKTASAVASTARSRRGQAAQEKQGEEKNYRLKRKVLDAYIAPDGVEDEDSGYFDPSKAADLVARTVSMELERHEAELFHKTAPSEYLSDADQEGYCSALGVLLVLSAKNSDNGVVRLEGDSYGKVYRLSVSFGHYGLCSRLEDETALSDEEWEEYLGEEMAEFLGLCRNAPWAFEYESIKGGKVCFTLKLSLSDRKAHVFLRPLITGTTYRAVVKRITSVNWTK